MLTVLLFIIFKSIKGNELTVYAEECVVFIWGWVWSPPITKTLPD